MCINEEDLISFDMSIVFYYRDCEVTFKKFDQFYSIKITGISDFGNLLCVSKVFRKKHNRVLIIKYLQGEIVNIKKVHQIILNKEFGKDDKVNIK